MPFIGPNKQVSSLPTMSDLNMFDFLKFPVFAILFIMCIYTHVQLLSEGGGRTLPSVRSGPLCLSESFIFLLVYWFVSFL